MAAIEGNKAVFINYGGCEGERKGIDILPNLASPAEVMVLITHTHPPEARDQPIIT